MSRWSGRTWGGVTIPSRAAQPVVRPPKPDILACAPKISPRQRGSKVAQLAAPDGASARLDPYPRFSGVPFGVCERVLDDPAPGGDGRVSVFDGKSGPYRARGRGRRLLARLRDATCACILRPMSSRPCAGHGRGRAARCRALVRSLALRDAGLASKWNERAFWTDGPMAFPTRDC